MTAILPIETRQRIAVIGAGIGGLSAAWLLGQRHDVTILEAHDRIGGHAHTLEALGPKGAVPVDTGFIVYNEANYPNFTALLDHLGVASLPADMALSVSMDNGGFEYSSQAILAQKRNALSPRFWIMLADINRFYRQAPRDLARLESSAISLDDYLVGEGYSTAFRDDHLLPQAAAIWSTPLDQIRAYPAASLIRFFQNHGMMTILGRGLWRTVAGGSRNYVAALRSAFLGQIRTGTKVIGLRRSDHGAELRLADGSTETFDQVIVATHGDTALRLLDDPSRQETALLGAFSYSQNTAVLHTDKSLMPRRKAAWTSWNHIGHRARPDQGCVTYWMNKLQSLTDAPDLFVTLNPTLPIAAEAHIHTDQYDHPLFDAAAIAAQRQLWSLQGARGTWFCGSYFGHGFHEDALQSGLAVAEALANVRRPWTVAGESDRIHLRTSALDLSRQAA